MYNTPLTREQKVRMFREAGDSPIFDPNSPNAFDNFDMIFSCIEEEFEEFVEAACAYESNQNVTTRANLVKEWADLQYVVSQAACFYEIPGQVAFNRVHENNMTKVVDGKVRKREDGKILKPEGYEPADMRGL